MENLNLNDLLTKAQYDPAEVLVMRHQPTELSLRRILPWLAVENPKLYNAYQQAQNEKAENALLRAKALVSLVASAPRKAMFIGLYRNAGSKPLSYKQYWAKRENRELSARGMTGFGGNRPHILWFNLVRTDFHANWSGRLVVNWPGGERSWWRWADRNQFAIDTILPVSAAEQTMPPWRELVFTWNELKSLPSTWRDALSQWRGIYFICDTSDGRGYVGSAYGKENILGRWTNYAASGHGGNRQLRRRDPAHFHFSILERVSPDMEVEDIVQLEISWKMRLSTRSHGLNDN
jgi:hypothetical protein